MRVLRGLLGAVGLGLALTTGGCSSLLPSLSPSSSASTSLAPNGGRDPTPLGKCSVAMSQSRPLVTEWPASEKSRLEALLGRGGVAVAYSGCEMRLIESCSVGGSYSFQRTTLASDQLEIQNEDDLYGKLPLGALRLEGDLRRAGRLAVKTTVVGQFLLSGGTADPAPTGACADVTHIITGMSVGAFKLLAGGKMAASAAVGGPVGGVGGGGAREEVTLTEAGDEKACAESKSNEAPDRCRSPLQLFLQKTSRAGAASADRPAAGSTLFDGKVLGDERWSLYRGGEILCTLPCRLQIDPRLGPYRLAGAGDSLELKPRSEWLGRTAQIEVTPSRGSLLGLVLLGTGVGVGGMAVMIGGFTAYSSTRAPDNETDAERDSRKSKQIGFFFGGFGVWVLGGLGIAYYQVLYRRDAAYDLLLIETRTGAPRRPLRWGLDGVAWQPSDSTLVHLSPFGLAGHF
jgi:hypothetical protein